MLYIIKMNKVMSTGCINNSSANANAISNANVTT